MLTDKLNLQGRGLKLLNFKEVNKGAVLYKFDLTIDSWCLTIKECQLIKTAETSFVSFPSRMYEVEGQKKFMNYVFMEKEKKAKLDHEVKLLIKEKFTDV